MKTLALAAAALAAATMPATASAALLNFDLTGSFTASFQLDSEAAPDAFNENTIVYSNLSGSLNGAPTVIEQLRIVDFDTFMRVRITAGASTDLSGNNLFSGTTERPVFTPSTYQLLNLNNGSTPVTLIISDPAAAAVPEPATWSLMLLGLGMVGAGLRSRRCKFPVTYN